MSQDEKGSSPQSESKGVLITEGAEFSIHGLQLRVTPDGLDVSDHGTSLRQDLCRHWLRLAVDHVLDSQAANTDMLAADAQDDSELLSTALEREFRSSMQAIVSSAIALDAFYAAVKDRIAVPDDQARAWGKKRTARWKQMAEVFRLGFGLRDDKVAEVRKILKEIAKYRGWVVHPPADQKAPVRHPEIARSVEWRFVAFRHENARTTVRMTLSFVRVLAGQPNSRFDTLTNYCEGMAAAIDRLLPLWTERYPDFPVE